MLFRPRVRKGSRGGVAPDETTENGSGENGSGENGSGENGSGENGSGGDGSGGDRPVQEAGGVQTIHAKEHPKLGRRTGAPKQGLRGTDTPKPLLSLGRGGATPGGGPGHRLFRGGRRSRGAERSEPGGRTVRGWRRPGRQTVHTNHPGWAEPCGVAGGERPLDGSPLGSGRVSCQGGRRERKGGDRCRSVARVPGRRLPFVRGALHHEGDSAPSLPSGQRPMRDLFTFAAQPTRR